MTTKDVRFWLEEKDLKTPIHDEMVIWCFNNPKKILSDLNLLPPKTEGFFRNSCYEETNSYTKEKNVIGIIIKKN